MTAKEELERAANRIPDFTKRMVRRNKYMVSKARESAGPLFADHAEAEVQLTNATSEYWRWRHGLASGAGWMGPTCPIGKALQWIRLAAIEHHSRQLIRDDSVWGLVKTKIRQTYPMPSYGPSVWMGILDGSHPISMRVWVVDDQKTSTGKRIEEELFPSSGSAPLMTREEFDRLFRIPAPEDTDGGPDAELLERFLDRIRGKMVAA